MAAAEKNKPTIYGDTNVISVMFLRLRDLETSYRRVKTRDWWEHERTWFRVLGSGLLESELRNGVYFGQERAIATARRLPNLPVTKLVDRTAATLMLAKIVPESQYPDAMQLGIAIFHRIDYLLTWNYSHIANSNTERRLNKLVAAENWRTPLLVSPETIPQVRFGHSIRRSIHEN